VFYAIHHAHGRGERSGRRQSWLQHDLRGAHQI